MVGGLRRGVGVAVRMGVGMDVGKIMILAMMVTGPVFMLVFVSMLMLMIMIVSMLMTVVVIMGMRVSGLGLARADPRRVFPRQTATAIVTHQSISKEATSNSRPARSSRLAL